VSTRRRRAAAHEEEEENAERWTVSYMDMVTVMMCLFIVLFAISQVDSAKFQELRQSLASGFGEASPAVTVVDGSTGVLDGGNTHPVDIAPIDGAEDLKTLQSGRDLQVAAEQEVESLTELQEQIRSDLSAAGLEGEVRFSITERGLVIGLVSQHTFFSPASAAMPETTLQVVDTVAASLAGIGNSILLEGHANHLPRTEPYATNWELSADRATKVLRRMVEHTGIAPDRVRAIGYGDAYPAVTEGPDALDLNRRVDIVVMSEQPETVRQLMPSVAANREGV